MGTVKRVSLELGGNAPFIVFDDADLEAALDGVMASKFRNTGQTCVCANRIYVQSGVYEAFSGALAARAAALRPGDGLAGPTDQGPLINAAALAKVERHVADALEGGARVLTGARRLPGKGLFYAPTVLADVPAGAGLISTEVAPFGGVKESGLGREGSRYGLEEYLETKMVCLSV